MNIKVKLDKPYDILIQKGIFNELDSLVKPYGKRSVVVTDSNVAKLLPKLNHEIIVFPYGEENKTRKTKEYLEDELVKRGHGRDSCIIAIGGGVVGDVAGFVAATYFRGINYIQVPTTLLAMVDSSIGGKVAVDHPLGKNLIGAFHQPRLVMIDIEFLRTLQKEQFMSGFAEIIKHALIADWDMFELIESNLRNLGDEVLISGLIKRSIDIKKGIVERDEKESGERKILNFGHTIGHAIEVLMDYKMLHGQAVALGIHYEINIAGKLGILDAVDVARIDKLLSKSGYLKQRIDLDPDEVVKATYHDKKAKEGKPRYSLIDRIGNCRYDVLVDDSIVLDSLR